MRSKYSIEFRNEVRAKDLVNLIKQVSYYYRKYENENIVSVASILYNDGKYTREEIDCGIKLMNSYYSKLSRLRRRFKKMLDFVNSHNDKELVFLTLTLSEESLKIDYKTLRVYLRRFLNNRFCDYVANSDFGDIHDRLHFHALVIANKGHYDLDYWLDKFGYYFYEKVNLKSKDLEIIKLYMTKLINHSIKDSTKSNDLIYCRSKIYD